MAYHDSNPERRNLVGLSLSIIIFYLAGGSFTSHEVRLQVINVTFSKPEILALAIWFVLLWFLYRYWLVNQGSWKKDFYNEIVQEKFTSFVFYNRMKSIFLLSNDYSNSYFPNKHWLKITNQGPEKLVFHYIYKDLAGKQFSETKEISGVLNLFLMFLCVAWIFLRRPTLSTYFMPYILFVIAAIFGVMTKL